MGMFAHKRSFARACVRQLVHQCMLIPFSETLLYQIYQTAKKCRVLRIKVASGHPTAVSHFGSLFCDKSTIS